MDKHTAGAESAESQLMDEMLQDSTELPVRFQKPTFLMTESGNFADQEEFTVPVGADISSNRGPVTLRDILKRLAALKRMNVSWADDVDQMALVDVDIRAEDDFYIAIENILRQLDYLYEIKGNSIVVRYRDTKTFQIAMPFITPEFSTGVGGDVLGGSGSKQQMKGLIELKNSSQDDSFDIWANIEKNLNEILKVYSETQVEATFDTAIEDKTSTETTDTKAVAGKTENAKMVRTRNQGALGYYMIDKPVGVITVTAPRSLLSKIENYIEQLKKVVYQQVSIEAKIVEVTLSGDTTTGIDWNSLLSSKSLSGFIDFQKLNPFYADFSTNPTTHRTQNQFLELSTTNFAVILDAMKEQGHVEVLANPRISVMNGQPALISVGTDTRYVSSISVTVSERDKTYAATTDSVVSGLGLAVVATVLNGEEVVLNLTPVTSELLEMGSAQIGAEGFVGLPVVRLRELSSTIRVKSGNMLVVGGLIDSNNAYNENKVVGLGDVPGISKLFGRSGNVLTKKEMVILLRPVILN
ncbi:MAG: type II and III secretion system protein [Proteobacteria bacterium]|nr:type II and III secretion system protein [Pseudomonadota bacterium]MBU1640912.1 type II and III secretion system protein [Pseudomonadota bacterium]